MAKRASPFIFEDAVPTEKFFNRSKEIDFLIKNLEVKKKMLLCIVAPLKYGKTSLMMKYLEILRRHEDIVPIYINLKIVDTPIKFIVENLEKYGINVWNEYRKAKEEKSLMKMFEKIWEKIDEKKVWLFLLFDEFHLLPELVRNEGFYQRLPDEYIFGFFRGFAEGKNISYIVCGSIIEPLINAIDVWGGRFQVLYLGPFNKEDAVLMIKKLFSEGGMEIDEESAVVIAEAAGFHPFYIQYMGHQIYIRGTINRETIRIAKQQLYEYITPIFTSYIERIKELNINALETLRKIVKGETLEIDDIAQASKLMKIGFLKPRNGIYEIVDPLFERYLNSIFTAERPVEVLIVGHWAERLVGNILARKGYIPYYAHESKSAFDIYVKVKQIDVGIQVKYSTKGEFYLSNREAETILSEAKKLNWKPIIALVSKKVKFYNTIKPGKYSISQGYSDIEEALETS